jgi:hypothetical protein
MSHAPTHPPHHPTHLRRCGRVGVVLALLALLLGQALGLAHRVVHDTAHAGLPSTERPTASDVRDFSGAVDIGALPWSPHGSHGLADPGAHDCETAGGLFDSHEEGSAECRLLDQLAHADVLLASVVATPDVLPAAEQHSVPTGAALGRHSAVYEARAPPGPAGRSRPNPAALSG